MLYALKYLLNAKLVMTPLLVLTVETPIISTNKALAPLVLTYPCVPNALMAKLAHPVKQATFYKELFAKLAPKSLTVSNVLQELNANNVTASTFYKVPTVSIAQILHLIVLNAIT